MKRQRELEQPVLTDDAWALIHAACGERERWLPVCRAWSALARGALWLRLRDTFRSEPEPDCDLSILATLPYMNSAGLLMDPTLELFEGLWRRVAREHDVRYASPDFCRGFHALRQCRQRSGVALFQAIDFPPVMRHTHLLVLRAHGNYALLDFEAYRALVEHDNPHEPLTGDTCTTDACLLPRQVISPVPLCDVVLPVAWPVRFYDAPLTEFSLPDFLLYTWSCFIASEAGGDELARHLSQRHACDEAARAAVQLMCDALRSEKC